MASSGPSASGTRSNRSPLLAIVAWAAIYWVTTSLGTWSFVAPVGRFTGISKVPCRSKAADKAKATEETPAAETEEAPAPEADEAPAPETPEVPAAETKEIPVAEAEETPAAESTEKVPPSETRKQLESVASVIGIDSEIAANATDAELASQIATEINAKDTRIQELETSEADLTARQDKLIEDFKEIAQFLGIGGWGGVMMNFMEPEDIIKDIKKKVSTKPKTR